MSTKSQTRCDACGCKKERGDWGEVRFVEIHRAPQDRGGYIYPHVWHCEDCASSERRAKKSGCDTSRWGRV